MYRDQNKEKPKDEKEPINGMEFINLAEIGGICNTHHWLRGDGRPWWLPDTSKRIEEEEKCIELNISWEFGGVGFRVQPPPNEPCYKSLKMHKSRGLHQISIETSHEKP